jgi:NTE family protein
MDGGLADNIGLREPELGIAGDDDGWGLQHSVREGDVKRIVVIIVDAKPHEKPTLDESARPPNLISVLNASATNPMENYSAETVDLVREDFEQWDGAARNFDLRQQRVAERCDQLSKEMCASSRSKDCEATHRTQCRATFYPPDTDRPVHPKLYRIHVRFRSIKDPELRAQLESTPTRLQLPRRDVDALIHAGNELLRSSEAYQTLLRDLEADGE